MEQRLNTSWINSALIGTDYSSSKAGYECARGLNATSEMIAVVELRQVNYDVSAVYLNAVVLLTYLT